MKDVENFTLAINELNKTNLLNALEGIKKLLIVIATAPKLTETLKKASIGFDFPTEFEKAFIKNHICYEDTERYVALVTALLYALDQNNIGLEELLNIVYPQVDKNKAYQAFLFDIILPFKESFIKLVDGQQKTVVKDTKPKDLEKINQDLKQYIKVICDKIESNDTFEQVAKDEALTALYGLNYTLSYNDALLTRIVYSGLINTLFLFRFDFQELDEIGNLLKLYGVL